MAQYWRVLTMTLILFAISAMDARAQRLLDVDGIELRGNSQLVMSGGGTCNVLESDTSFEGRKQNHGAPMDIWRLDFSVHNGSGRWLDHLIARYLIESKWPECTNWDVPDAAAFPQSVEWAGYNGHIQQSGRNVVAPGRTLTATHLFIVLRGDAEPRFSQWSMDFDFATAPPDSGSAVAEQQTVPVATPEQENIFWQSIVDSTNPTMFEAYLAQFPNGVFRALAEARLAELRGSPDAPPASAVRVGGGASSAPAKSGAPSDAPRRPGDVFRDCYECPEMAVMPGGRLALGRYEVTVREYREFAIATGGGAGGGCADLAAGGSWRNPGFPQTDRHPVTCVSWDDAQAYVSWLTQRAGAPYRLPTESEWESAAVGSQRGCDSERTGGSGTCPVGSHGSNPVGLYDMVGNLWEWMNDCDQEDFCFVRGSSWEDYARSREIGAREFWLGTSWRDDDIGFRVAKTVR